MAIPYIVIEPESPNDPVVVYRPQPGCYVLGRQDVQVDVILADSQVSRRHALLFVEEGRVLVRDENSTKGVLVDGKRISPQTSVPIDSSNNVTLGTFLLYVTSEIDSGVKAKSLAPKIYAGISEKDLAELRGKVADVTGKTLDAGALAAPRRAPAAVSGKSTMMPGGGSLEDELEGLGATLSGLPPMSAQVTSAMAAVKGAPAAASEAQAAEQPQQDTRYTFPPMPEVPAEEQDKVDRFIYRRVKPLFDQLIQERTGGSANRNIENIRDLAEDVLGDILKQQEQHIPGGLSREDMLKLSVAAFMEYGPLQGLFGDETVTEVMVNSANDIFVEQKGKLFKSHLRFWSEQELRRVIEKMVMVTNRRIDEQQPYQDTRLEDGSRVNIIIRPISLAGDSITIRKFPNKRLYVDDLIKFGSMNREMADFLKRIVDLRANTIVSGGTGSGKTTLLNVLSNFIPKTERLVSIEDAAELRLNQPNKVTLEARPKSLEGGGAITIRDLVINALRMRPDRIIVGECRGGEAMDMLQAMNTGHDGSLTTLHANSPRDAIGRLETMCLMSGMELPAKAIRSQIVSAVNFIVQQTRLADGSRKVIAISEILGLEGEQVVMQEIFKFERQGISDEGKIRGRFVATGVIPQFVSKLRENKIDFPIEIFKAPED